MDNADLMGTGTAPCSELVFGPDGAMGTSAVGGLPSARSRASRWADFLFFLSIDKGSPGRI